MNVYVVCFLIGIFESVRGYCISVLFRLVRKFF